MIEDVIGYKSYIITTFVLFETLTRGREFMCVAILQL